MPSKGMYTEDQAETCRRFGVAPSDSPDDSKLGIALGTLGKLPINGLRHLPVGDTCGWHVWCGKDFSEAADFFSPLHVSHLPEYCPEIIPYLALPPGWRFLLAPGYEDVWFDRTIVHE